jgi:peptide/nickel transport system permease protein
MTAVSSTHTRDRQRFRVHARNVDAALFAGMLFFGLLILVAVYGPLVAPHDLYYSRTLVDGRAPPFPASPEYPLGSDGLGRDRLSWMLIAARGSVAVGLSAAALRVTVGATLGLIAGFRGGFISSFLRRVALAVSSVPGLVAALLAVIALGLGPVAFVLALGLTGWAEPFQQARRYGRAESARSFIEAARSLGMSERRVLLRHLFPNVAPQLLTTAAFQVSAVFLLMAELALLNIFVGGAVVVDYDSRGNAIVAPVLPNWGSMLAATRPIVSLYGDLASVLLPGGALLASVLATNLIGDALAARAQRLDVYRLFSRRQLVAAALICAAVFLSVQAWPSRLSSELEYARPYDAQRAVLFAGELVSLGPRTAGSSALEVSAALLASRLEGQIVRGSDAAVRVAQSKVEIAGSSLPDDPANVLSIDDADVSGPLLYIDFQSLVSGRTAPDIVTGAVVLLAEASPGVVGNVEQRLSSAHAKALIVLDSTGFNFRRESGLYSLPTVRTTPTALGALLHRGLPDLRTRLPRYEVLAQDARVFIETERLDAPVADVLAVVPGSELGAPAVLLVARFDQPPGLTQDSATASAALVTIVEHVRAHPLPLAVAALATTTDDQNFAGLRLALARLEPSMRARLQAIILVGPLLSDHVSVETQVDPGLASGTGRIAARLHDAFGVEVLAHPAGDLLRAIQSEGAPVAPLTVSAIGVDTEPSFGFIRASATVILATLAYIAGHQDEMR